MSKVVPTVADEPNELDKPRQNSLTAKPDRRLSGDSGKVNNNMTTQQMAQFEPSIRQVQEMVEKGKLVEAEVLCKTTLTELSNALGGDSVEALRVTGLLANIQQKQNKLNDSESMHKLTVDGLEKLYGKDGEETLVAMHNFAGSLARFLKKMRLSSDNISLLMTRNSPEYKAHFIFGSLIPILVVNIHQLPHYFICCRRSS
jgi:hypothetical protein